MVVINKEAVLQELHTLYQGRDGPFPYNDLRKMRKAKTLAAHFKNVGADDWLSAT